MNHRDSQAISQAQFWRGMLARDSTPQQERPARCWHLTRHQRSQVHSAGGAASSLACEHTRH